MTQQRRFEVSVGCASIGLVGLWATVRVLGEGHMGAAILLLLVALVFIAALVTECRNPENWQ